MAKIVYQLVWTSPVLPLLVVPCVMDLPKVSSLINYHKEVFPCSCCSCVLLVNVCKAPQDDSIVNGTL